MHSERVDDKTERWADPRGTLEITTVRPGVVLQRFRGHAMPPMADAIAERLERELARHGRIVVFDDWEEATGYESEVRIKLTAWTQRYLDRIPETHILVRSRLVAMGISVANLALANRLRSYTSRKEFEAALDRAKGPEAKERISPG
ncbi:MAG: hypothetical protein OHK0013_08190 [Sandaracinaceae bacterium]